MPDNPPVDPSSRTFRVAFRGFDQSEVQHHLVELSAELDRLREERDRLAARLKQVGEGAHDFDALSHEIGQILTAAKEAADGLRSRAAEEVSTWRSEAAAEVSEQRRSAAEDAEALRTDAWAVSAALLAQADELKVATLKDTEREALALTGQSERDSHRMLANARREAEEQLRLAKMESERLLTEARSEHDAIVEAARKSAETSQERARALEVRRTEMLEELESVRLTVARLESDLEEKREALERAIPEPEPEPSTTVRVLATDVSAEGEGKHDWSEETIRIIPAPHIEPPDPAEAVDATAIADEVRRMREEAAFESSTAELTNRAEIPAPDASGPPDSTLPLEPDTSEVAAGEVPTSESHVETSELDDLDTLPDRDEGTGAHGEGEGVDTPRPVEPPTTPADSVELAEEPRADELEGLFALLRENGSAAVIGDTSSDERPEEELPTGSDAITRSSLLVEDTWAPLPLPLGIDPVALRDQLVLPITNRVLRSVKRQLTEAQNIALEEVRVADGVWSPSAGDLAADLRGDFIVLAQEAFAAGYTAVETMTGQAPGRAKPIPDDIKEQSGEFAAALREALEHHTDGVEGPRQVSAAVSRTYRVWRTDEAERRIRGYARGAYHRGVSRAMETVGVVRMFWSVDGRGCPDCRTMAEHGPVSPGIGFGEDRAVPPAHDGCDCTIVPGG